MDDFGKVSEVHGGRHGLNEPGRYVRSHGRSIEFARERATLGKGHDVKRNGMGATDSESFDDVGVMQFRGRFRFRQKPSSLHMAGKWPAAHQLDRDEAIRFQVERTVDDSGSTSADFPKVAVTSDLRRARELESRCFRAGNDDHGCSDFRRDFGESFCSFVTLEAVIEVYFDVRVGGRHQLAVE